MTSSLVAFSGLQIEVQAAEPVEDDGVRPQAEADLMSAPVRRQHAGLTSLMRGRRRTASSGRRGRRGSRPCQPTHIGLKSLESLRGTFTTAESGQVGDPDERGAAAAVAASRRCSRRGSCGCS